jgi:hypothetical protein
MQLQAGDWVRTEDGKEGVIVMISRLSAFVKLNDKQASKTVSKLLSQLTKIEPREKQPGDS